MPLPPPANLSVVVCRGHQLRKVSRVVKDDPFVRGSVPGQGPEQACKTKTLVAGGSNPVWESKNTLRLRTGGARVVLLEVFDREFLAENRLIGAGELDLTPFEEDGAEDITVFVPLTFEGVPAGTLEVRIASYEPCDDGDDDGADTPTNSAQTTAPPLAPLPAALPARERWRRQVQQWISKLMAMTPSQRRTSLALFLYLAVAPHLVGFHLVFRLAWMTLALVLFSVLLPVSFSMLLPSYSARLVTWILAKVTAFSDVSIEFGAIHVMVWVKLKTISLQPADSPVPSPPSPNPPPLGARLWGSLSSSHVANLLNIEPRLFFRVWVDDFEISNPPGPYVGPFLRTHRVDIMASVSFSDLWHLAMRESVPAPLKKVPDFRKWCVLDVETLEVVGFQLDFQVAEGKLNINEMTKAFAVGDVKRAVPALRQHSPPTPWPNTLEVQVHRARNLLAMDRNGFSDPFAVVQVRGEKRKTSIVPVSLDPVWTDGVFQFRVSDPSAVVHVTLWDADVGKTADFLGQWMTTLKWIVADPEGKLKHVHGPLKVDPKTGWVKGWFPLQDRKWDTLMDKEGVRPQSSEVELSFRWIHVPGTDAVALPTLLKPIDQIGENQKETMLRLGNQARVIDMLNHVPVLFDIRLVVVREAKICIKDLFARKGRTRPTPLASPGPTPGTPLTPSSPSSPPGKIRPPPFTKWPFSTGRRRESSPEMPPPSPLPDVTSPAPPPPSHRRSRLGLWPFGSSSKPPDSHTSPTTTPPVTSPGNNNRAATASATATTATTTATTTGRSLFSASASAPLQSGDDGIATAARERSYSQALSESTSVSGVSGGGGDDDLDEADELIVIDDVSKRPFVEIPIITWTKQFRPRHGDPGITVYKVVHRFLFGLGPKLAKHSSVNLKLLRQTSHGLFMGLGDDILSLGSRVTGALSNVSRSIKAHTTFVKDKMGVTDRGGGMRGSTAAAVFTSLSRAGESDAGGEGGDDIVDGGPGLGGMPQLSATSTHPFRRVTAHDEDFNSGEVRMSGVLELAWARVTTTGTPAAPPPLLSPSAAVTASRFARLWASTTDGSSGPAEPTRFHAYMFEVKGDGLYCRRLRLGSRPLSMDLTAIVGLQVTESVGAVRRRLLRIVFRGHDRVLVLRTPPEPYGGVPKMMQHQQPTGASGGAGGGIGEEPPIEEWESTIRALAQEATSSARRGDLRSMPSFVER